MIGLLAPRFAAGRPNAPMGKRRTSTWSRYRSRRTRPRPGLFGRKPSEAGPDAHVSDAKLANRDISPRVKLAGAVVRAVFMILLVAVVFRVSSPQSETLWTAYDTPADLVRLALGLVAGAWIVVHLFMPPKDPAAYRTWLYLGLVLVPFAIVCAIVVW